MSEREPVTNGTSGSTTGAGALPEGVANTPGFAINYIALLDGVLIYSLIWMALGIFVPTATDRLQSLELA